MPSSNKTNSTAIRVLEVLKLLDTGMLRQNDILANLSDNNKIDCELRKEALYKYFNTFKLLGINVIKKNKILSLEKSPITINLSQEEIEGLNFIMEYAKKIFVGQAKDEIQKLINNICRCTKNCTPEELKNHLSKKDIQNFTSPKNYDPNLLNQFRLLCKERQKISFTYINHDLNEKQKFEIEPDEVIITPVDSILKGYNPQLAETQRFYIDAIEDLVQLPTMSKHKNVKSSVTFMLKGRLSHSYELKHGERLTQKGKDYIVVTNSEEDKETLTRRLLRYGKDCEIIYPKIFRKRVLSNLEKILKNYN